VAIASRAWIENAPHGVRFAVDGAARLGAAQLRDLVDRGRR
jgi:hypothetical protein